MGINRHPSRAHRFVLHNRAAGPTPAWRGEPVDTPPTFRKVPQLRPQRGEQLRPQRSGRPQLLLNGSGHPFTLPLGGAPSAPHPVPHCVAQPHDPPPHDPSQPPKPGNLREGAMFARSLGHHPTRDSRETHPRTLRSAAALPDSPLPGRVSPSAPVGALSPCVPRPRRPAEHAPTPRDTPPGALLKSTSPHPRPYEHMYDPGSAAGGRPRAERGTPHMCVFVLPPPLPPPPPGGVGVVGWCGAVCSGFSGETRSPGPPGRCSSAHTRRSVTWYP